MALDLVARLSLKDDLSARMRKVTGELGRTEKQTRSLTDRMGGLKGALAGVGVTVGITALAKGILGIGVAFDTQMSKVKAVSGATDEQFRQLKDTARQLGKDTKFSMTEAAEGMEYLALAGWKTEAILVAMPGMLNLAAAGALDLGRAADITSDTMQAFGIASENATHVADVFAYAQANANTNVEQMGEAMKYAAPVANALGWQLEETAAAQMAMADAGLKGSIAGQAFASSMARQAKPTRQMSKMMDKLGVSFFDAKGEMLSMPDMIAELERGTKGLTSEQRSAAISTLFGAEAYKHWAILLERGSGELSRMTDELKNSDGAAAEMAATMIDNLGGAWQIFMSGVAEAAYSIYEKFEPALRGVVDVLTLIVDKVPAVVSVLSKLAKPFVPLAKAIGIAVLAVGSFMAIVGTFKLIGLAIAFVSAPMWLVIGAITALVLGFQMAYKHSEKFRKALSGIGNAFKTVWSVMKGDSKGEMLGITRMLKSGMSTEQVNQVITFANKLKDAFKKVKGVVVGVSKLFSGDEMVGITKMLKAGLSTDQVNEIIAFVDRIKGAFSRLGDVFVGLGTLIGAGNASDLLTALGFSADTITNIFAFVETVKTAVTEFVTYLGEKWAELQPTIALLIERFVSMKDTAISIFTTLWAFLQPIFGALGVAFQIIGDIAVMVWTNIIAPAINFVISMFQALWNVAGPILELLGAAIGVAFEILKVAWDTILKPVAEWLLGAFAAAFEAAKGHVDNIADAFGFLGEMISGAVTWFNKIKDAIKNFNVPDWLSKLGGGGTVKFEASGGDGGKKGKSNYHGIDYVPYNGFQASLHKGERVQTAQEVREQKQGGGGPVTITGNAFHVRQESDIEAIAYELAKLIERERGQMA